MNTCARGWPALSSRILSRYAKRLNSTVQAARVLTDNVASSSSHVNLAAPVTCGEQRNLDLGEVWRPLAVAETVERIFDDALPVADTALRELIVTECLVAANERSCKTTAWSVGSSCVAFGRLVLSGLRSPVWWASATVPMAWKPEESDVGSSHCSWCLMEKLDFDAEFLEGVSHGGLTGMLVARSHVYKRKSSARA